MPTKRKKPASPRFKSKFEKTISDMLGNKVLYEPDTIKYTVPESYHKYRPDFKLAPNVYIETKGKLVASDRRKHLLVKEQHPEIKICFLFQNAQNKLRKGSPTTYSMWCDKNGLSWIDGRTIRDAKDLYRKLDSIMNPKTS